MCHFITMVAPANTDMDLLKVALKKVHRSVYLVENRHVKKHMKAGELYFCALPGYCDCGTALGSILEQPAETVDLRTAWSKEINKFRRKGWSETKIERWLKDLEKTNAKKEPHECADGPDEWPGLIRALLKDYGLPYVGILLHMYSGGFDTSPKDIKRVAFDLGEDLGPRLYRMKEDVLYIVKR